MYTPQNVSVYLRAFAGFMAGISGSAVTDPLAVDYTVAAEMADAFAQQLDVEWGSSVPTLLELYTIQSVAQEVWSNRSPPPFSVALSPGAYTTIALAIVARVLQGNAQVVAEGIDPNGSGTPGTGTVVSVSGAPPIVITGNPTVAPIVNIRAATIAAAGSMSAADKLKLDNLSASEVTAVTAGAPLASSGGATPNVTASAFTAATSGLAHVTTASLDVAPFKGDTAGKIPTTNAGATDVAFDFLFGPWTADIVPGASPRTLLASEIMAAVNTSTGAVTVLTPLAQDGASLPTNGQVFCVKPVAASATPITVQANGAGVTVENPSNAGNFGATGLVPGQGSGAWFKYRLSDKKWICMPGSGA